MTAREAALKALYSIEVSGAYTNAALKEALSRDGLSVRDKGFVTELIYGVVSNKTAIDYIISRFSKIKIKKMTPWVLNILRMGIYQIYYMDKIPHSAACNEAVILAKKYSHGAGAGFVNGVLRTGARELDGFSFPKTGDKVRDLSLEYSYPEWITKRLCEEYGEDRCEELFKENQKAHSTAIRVNTLKTDTGKLTKILKEEGLECSFCENLDNALILKGKLNIEHSPAYRDGLYSLQNISSQKAVKVLSPKPFEFVIDMCAAPGGKSCAIAENMENQGRVLSFDIFEHKIELINRAARRLGIDIIEAKVSDSSKKCDNLLEKADRVLADVPCSGLGVIHKKPDIKWSRQESDIEALCKIQCEILNNAAEYVKPGGVLVYSTCTILPEENRLRIDEFLKTHAEFEKVHEEQLLTSDLGESGFYICKMIKERAKK
jgi:16S rRNA (cytosine967-C5)-methyltransferase